MTRLALEALFFAAVGVIIGTAYFRALRWNVRLYCGGERMALALFIHVLRMLAVAAALIPIARSGLAPLLSAVAGFQLAKLIAVRMRATPSEAAS